MSQNHKVHKYQRIILGSKGYKVMKCLLPNCPHFIRIELAIGKLCICWRCNKEFVLTQKHLRMKKPHCEDCTKSHVDIQLAKLGVS